MADPPESASCDKPNPGNLKSTFRNDYPTRAGYGSLPIGSVLQNEKPPTSVCKWGVVTGIYCDYNTKTNWPAFDDMPKADHGDSGGPVFLICDEDRSLGKPGYVHAIGIVINDQRGRRKSLAFRQRQQERVHGFRVPDHLFDRARQRLERIRSPSYEQ